MALVDVEGAPVYLRQLTIAHHMASWESIQEILIRHYTRQLLHEIYKVNWKLLFHHFFSFREYLFFKILYEFYVAFYIF